MKEIEFRIKNMKTIPKEELEKLNKNINAALRIISKESDMLKLTGILLNLSSTIDNELRKRSRAKNVWVKFTATWSGYTSKQERVVAIVYKKLGKDFVRNHSLSFTHNFSDNTYNYWTAKEVLKEGNDSFGTYEHQVDSFLEKEVRKDAK